MLSQKTALSGSLLIVGRLLSRVIDLATITIFTRLLSPTDFGLVAIAMTMVTILESIFELPLSQALVQLPEIKPCLLHTAFTINLIRGIIICGLCSSLAIPFSHWYGHPELTSLIQALSLAPAARGMQTPRLAEYAKAFNFTYEFWFELVGKSFAFIVAIVFADETHSYWAIGIFTITGPLTMSILGYVFIPYRPHLSLNGWRLFVDFLGWNSFSQLLNSINSQAEQLLLGKLLPTAKFGLFSTANSLSMIPLTALFSPIIRPLMSAFTLMRADAPRLRQSYLSASSAVVAVGLPLLVGQAVLAEPIVLVLLGPKWANAVTMTRWLSISMIPGLFGSLLSPVAMSLGSTRELAWRSMVEVLAKLPLVVLGAITYGFTGVIAARILSGILTAIFCMVSIRGLIGLTIWKQFYVNVRYIIATLIMLTVLIPFSAIVRLPETLLGQSLKLILLVSAGILIYSTSTLLIWNLLRRPQGLEEVVLRNLNLLRRGSKLVGNPP